MTKLVLVEWVDSTSGYSWRTVDEATREADHNIGQSCYSAGFLITDDADYVTLAFSAAPDQKPEPLVGETISIPRAAIRRIRTLTPGRALRR
jgi:hypothetical protein